MDREVEIIKGFNFDSFLFHKRSDTEMQRFPKQLNLAKYAPYLPEIFEEGKKLGVEVGRSFYKKPDGSTGVGGLITNSTSRHEMELPTDNWEQWILDAHAHLDDQLLSAQDCSALIADIDGVRPLKARMILTPVFQVLACATTETPRLGAEGLLEERTKMVEIHEDFYRQANRELAGAFGVVAFDLSNAFLNVDKIDPKKVDEEAVWAAVKKHSHSNNKGSVDLVQKYKLKMYFSQDYTNFREFTG